MTAPLSFPPFAFGSFLAESFSETRRRDADLLRTLLQKGEPTAVIAEPGMGRSDLVHNLVLGMSKEGRTVVEVSVAKCFDSADFFERLINKLLSAVARTADEWTAQAEDLLRTVPHSIVQDSDGLPVVRIDHNDWLKNLLYLANLPEIIADRLSIRLFIAVYDVEHFSAFDGGPGAFSILLDALNAGTRIQFTVTGTETADLKPVYHHLSTCCSIIRLGRIPQDEWVKFIVETFKIEAKHIDAKAATSIVATVNGLSAYVLELAWHTWIVTEDVVTSKELNRGFDLLLNSYGPRFIVMIRDMSDEERFLLISLVLGKKSVNASKSTVRSLSSLGLLRILNGKPVLHDPVLAKWILAKYLPSKAAGKPIF